MSALDSAALRQNVLFLCTGNSARSILAEVLLNARGGERFQAFSAGSRPVGRVNPGAMAELSRRGHDLSALRSKSWDEFAGAAAPPLRWVFTVCDNAAGESCPIWRGTPHTVHWGLPDPAAVVGECAVAEAFGATYDALAVKVDRFLSLTQELDDDEVVAELQKLPAV